MRSVFVGGRIFSAGTIGAAAVAVRDGRIAYVGDEADARAVAGPGADVVDCTRRLLLPGFQDAHVHPVAAGLQLLQCDLHDLHTEPAYLRAISRYAAEHPDRPWITGGGWSMDVFPGGNPTKLRLDAVVPDRPVYLPSRDGHSAWVNSRALEAAGFGRDMPDPPDGRIERDEHGEPSGTLHEGAADLVGRLLPEPSDEELDAALLAAQEYLFSLGVTGWQDAIVGTFHGFSDNLPVYIRAAEAGTLVAHVTGALWWDRERGLDQLADLRERRAAGNVGRFSATSVKIMQDGIAENWTAAMTAPYADHCGHPTDNAGLSFVDPVALREYVTKLDASGFQVHFHALGDRAVREALDAVAAALEANGPAGHRHHLAHLQVVHPDDVPRFATLGATATIQPLWACHEPQMDELTIPFLGGDLAGHQYPFRSLHDRGTRLAAGSDWMVSSPDPLLGAHVAVNRVSPHRDIATTRPFQPHQALDLATILTAYTAGSAYVNHRERTTGSIEVGLDADLVLLDRDPFTGPPEGIRHARVTRTYVQGNPVHTTD